MSKRHIKRNTYRYRMTPCASYKAEKAADRVIPMLGAIKRVRAYRITTERDGLLTWREQLLVVGERGSARFNGCCWGYGGDGPRAVHKILTLCGLDKDTAWRLAFNTTRLDKDGVSWEWTPETAAIHRAVATTYAKFG